MSIMDFCRKNKGSISIFLCLVLLPMVTYATMIVDASRLQASKSAISGAGDLALNSVMSEYDPDLKKLYGIFAVYGQNEDALKNELNKYFKDTLKNSIPQKDTNDYIDNFFNDVITGIFDGSYESVNDIEFDNFLTFNTENTDALLTMGSPVSDTSALERQINEYMKYRGPVSLGTNLLEKLNILKDSSKQTNVVNQKLEYTEQLSNVQSACDEAWQALVEYNTEVTNVRGYVENNDISDVAQKEGKRAEIVQNLMKKYNELNYRYKDLVDLTSLDKCKEFLKSKEKNKYLDNLNSNSYVNEKTSSDIMDTTAKDMIEILNTLENCGISFTPKASEYDISLPEDNGENTEDNGEDTEDNEEENTQNETIEVSCEDNFSNNITENMNRLNLNFNIRNEEISDDEIDTQVGSFYDTVGNIYDNIEKYAEIAGFIDAYTQLYEIYENKSEAVLASELKENVKSKITENRDYFRKVNDILKGKRDYITNMFAETSTSKLKEKAQEGVNQICSSLMNYSGKFNTLGSEAKDVCDKLDAVITALENAETSKEKWGEAVDGLDAGNTKSAMQSDFDTTTTQITKEDINELKEVMAQRKDVHDNDCLNIKKIKFFGIEVDKLNFDYIDFEKAVAFEHCFYGKGDLIKKERYLWVQEDKDLNDKEIKFYNILKGIANPVKSDLSEETSNTTGNINEGIKTNGWDIKSDNFNNISSEDQSKLYKINSENMTDSKVSEVKIYTDDDDKSKNEKSKNARKSLESANKFLANIQDMLKNLAETALLEEYTTEMFSCYTDGKEKKFETLSGSVACKENNNLEENEFFAPYYGAEIEYLLWGGNNPGDSVARNCAMIYLIRFALNAVFAFTSPEITSFSLEVATAIAGWTVVGVPIVQAIIIIAIAMGESALDIMALLDGEEVPIYKSASTWKLSATGLFKEVAKVVVDTTAAKIVDCSEKKINEIVDEAKNSAEGQSEKIKNYINSVAETKFMEISDVVRTNITTPIVNTIQNYTFSAEQISDEFDKEISNVYTDIDNKIKQLPPLVSDLASAVFDEFKKNYPLEDLKNRILNNSPEKVIDEITNKINEVIIGKEKDYVEKVKNELDKEIGEIADKTGEEAKKAIKNGINEVSSNISQSIDSAIPDDKNIMDKSDASKGKTFTLNYKEYCKIFMCIRLFTEKENVLNRTSSLIGLNVSKKKNNNDFNMSEAYTMFQINADVEMPTIFNWNVSVNADDNSLSFDNTSNNSVKIKYSAVNGY